MATVAQQTAFQRAYGTGKSAANGYLEQEVMQWSPEKIILKTYDLFIVACKKGDIVKMNRVLVTLMTSLNFEYSEPSSRLYRLYEYCQKCISERRFDDALFIVENLRATWAQAFNLK